MCVLLDIIQKSDNIKYVNILRRHQHCKLLHNASRAARSHAVLVIPVAADRTRMLLQSSRPTHHDTRVHLLTSLYSKPDTSYLHSKMAGKKGGGENSKKAAGQARVCFFVLVFLYFVLYLFFASTPPPL